MGAAISAPLYAVSTFLGSFCAMGCCKLAWAGEVSSTKGAKCLLLWLQVIFLTMAMWMLSTEHKWIDTVCETAADWASDYSGIGICQCQNANANVTLVCRQQQMVLRTGAAAETVFAFMSILSVSGCASEAARSLPVLKFMMIPILTFCFLFVDNNNFDNFGKAAGTIAAFFSIAQIFLLMNFAYAWNSSWFEMANSYFREDSNSCKGKAFLGGVLVASLGFIGLSIYLPVQVQGAYTGSAVIVWSAFVVSAILLVISALEVIKHGTLLVSAAIMAFVQYLAWQAFAMQVNDDPSQPMWKPGLAFQFSLAIVTLLVLLCYDSGEDEEALDALITTEEKPATEMPQIAIPAATAAKVEEGAAGAPATFLVVQAPAAAAEPELPPVSAYDFGLQCLVQTVAVAYLTALIASQKKGIEGNVASTAHIIAMFFGLFLYGWTLVAPILLSGREFNY